MTAEEAAPAAQMDEALDQMAAATAADPEALRRAAEQFLRASADPLAMAAENARLRAAQTGAYAIIHALVQRLGGHVHVEGPEYRAIPPNLKLEVAQRDDGSVDLDVLPENRAARRARGRR